MLVLFSPFVFSFPTISCYANSHRIEPVAKSFHFLTATQMNVPSIIIASPVYTGFASRRNDSNKNIFPAAADGCFVCRCRPNQFWQSKYFTKKKNRTAAANLLSNWLRIQARGRAYAKEHHTSHILLSLIVIIPVVSVIPSNVLILTTSCVDGRNLAPSRWTAPPRLPSTPISWLIVLHLSLFLSPKKRDRK